VAAVIRGRGLATRTEQTYVHWIMRFMECVRLRVQDIDFGCNQITVRTAKGGKDQCAVCHPAVVSTGTQAGDSYPGAASCAADGGLDLGGAPGGIAQSLGDVFRLQVGIEREHLSPVMAARDHADDHADRHTHPANAGLTPHDRGIEGDSVEALHLHGGTREQFSAVHAG